MSTSRGASKSMLNGIGRRLGATFIYLIDQVVPKSRRLLIATFPDGDDQGAALCFALQRAGWNGQIDWLVEGKPGDFMRWQHVRGLGSVSISFVKRNSLAGLWRFLRARWVFYTHGLYFSYHPPGGKTVVNMWHGMPIKKIWQGVPGSYVPQPSFLLSTSPFFSGVLMRASGLGKHRLLECGLPRNDFLLNCRSEVAAEAAHLRGNAERLIFFLPTYRKSKIGFITNDGVETETVLGMAEADAVRLHEWLRHSQCKLLVKPHPMSIHAGANFKDDDQWAMIDEHWLITKGIGLYELLSQVDLLITDSSSIFVDFLATGKPQILFFPDLEKYQQSRGLLVEPFEDYTPGPIARDYAHLEMALDAWNGGNDDWLGRRQHLRELMIPPRTRPAAETVLETVGVFCASTDTSIEPKEAVVGAAVALVWAQYGPYHFARMRETARALGTRKLLGVEIGSKTTSYSWARGESTGDLHTLCPGMSAESVSPLTVYSRALNLFRRHHVEVVLVPSYWPASSLAILLAARNAGARVVMMNDSHAHTAKAQGIWAGIKRRLVLQYDAALVAGTPQKEYFSQMGMRPEKIVLGYDAVDNEHFASAAAQARAQAEVTRARLGLPARYFLNVGRMVWKKNLEVLVDAYKLVREKLGEECPRLVLVGSGKLAKALQERCLAHGLSVWQAGSSAANARRGDADVFVYGFRQVDELPAFYALAECFVLPSREEEWGLVVNEAMACGLPVLVSKVAGCARDLVKPGENGFHFDPFKAGELAELLEIIARRPQQAAAMGEASQRIIANWGCDRFAVAAREAVEIALK